MHEWTAFMVISSMFWAHGLLEILDQMLKGGLTFWGVQFCFTVMILLFVGYLYFVDVVRGVYFLLLKYFKLKKYINSKNIVFS